MILSPGQISKKTENCCISNWIIFEYAVILKTP